MIPAIKAAGTDSTMRHGGGFTFIGTDHNPEHNFPAAQPAHQDNKFLGDESKAEDPWRHASLAVDAATGVSRAKSGVPGSSSSVGEPSMLTKPRGDFKFFSEAATVIAPYNEGPAERLRSRSALPTATDREGPQSPIKGRFHGETNLLPPQEAMRIKLHFADSGPTPASARGRRRPNQSFESPKADHEPSIQVTIGRVEVKAEVSGQSTIRAQRAASPVMTLDEYLRRRSKRGGE